MGSSGSDRRPRIGLTTYAERACWNAWDRPAALLPCGYVDAVVAAGGVPVLLPPQPVNAAAVALDGVDGLVLSGGADLDPSRYGADPHPATGSPQPHRDAWEYALAEAALARDLPLLGLCRGMQVLAVALGGTLHQHVPVRVGHEQHRPAPGEFGRVDVRVAVSSVLSEVLGERASVSCSHHQALDRLPDGLVPVAWADDGTVEAVEVPGRRFAVGVQWHPEEDVDDVRVLAALVQAARARTDATTTYATGRGSVS